MGCSSDFPHTSLLCLHPLPLPWPRLLSSSTDFLSSSSLINSPPLRPSLRSLKATSLCPFLSAPLIRGHCCFSSDSGCPYACVCLRVCKNILLLAHFLCLPLSTQGNHIVTAYFRMPTQPLFIGFSASLALFHPPVNVLHFHFASLCSPFS